MHKPLRNLVRSVNICNRRENSTTVGDTITNIMVRDQYFACMYTSTHTCIIKELEGTY